MPVESKASRAGRKNIKSASSMFEHILHRDHEEHTMSDHHCKESHFGRRILATLFGILIAYAIVLLGTMIRNNMQKFRTIGRADTLRQITVDADATVAAAPDVATLSMGFIGKAGTVLDAQQKNTAVMNDLVSKLKSLGIDSKDIQTGSYAIYPKTTVDRKGTVQSDGFEASQSVLVKIRDLSKASAVLSLAGATGANSVGGIQYTVDDPEIYRAQARSAALKKLVAKVKQLQESLGVRILDISSYNEFQPGSELYGSGGPTTQSRADFGVPSVQSGTNDMTMHVSVAFDVQ